jgi:hypothetical protein
MSPEDHRKRIEAVEQCLREGYKPRGTGTGYNKQRSAVAEAAHRLGIVRITMTSWATGHHDEIDWSLYKPPVSLSKQVETDTHRTMEAAQAKLRIRVSHARPRGPAETIKVCAIGDVHDTPGLSKDRARWMGKWVDSVKPDLVIQIGDLLTLDSLNGHVSDDTWTGRSKPTFEQDIASGAEFLGEFQAASGSHNPERHITLGNHEHRIWRYEDSAPATVGMMQEYLDEMIRNAGWGYSPFGMPYIVGNVAFVHIPIGLNGKPVGGKTSTAIIARDSVRDTVSGHTHRAEVSRVPKLGIDERVLSLNLGCALPDGHVESYVGHGASGWWWGGWTLTIHGGRIEGYEQISMRALQERFG